MDTEEKIVPIVDSSCIGCNICANIAGQTFEMQDTKDGLKSIVINPQGDTQEKIQEAIDICPVVAIHWQKINKQIQKDLRN